MSKRKARDLENDEFRDRISKRGKGNSGQSIKKRVDKLVTNANRLSADDFVSKYIDRTSLQFVPSRSSGRKNDQVSVEYTINLARPEDAGSAVLSQAFDLIEATQRDYYQNSSIGWHPKRKTAEMREDTMRYLLARQKPKEHSSLEPLLGYLSFMLTFDSIPSVPVLYIYEIHVDGRSAGKGLGSHLMQIAENIAREVGLEKIMLTCFLRNEKAKRFYEERGFVKDVCSPEDREVRRKVVKVDYWIMSKLVVKNSDPVTSSTAISKDDAGKG
nr:N-alpha-acetyltransferase 40-like [Quercus suber]POF15480.1 n-alpha-acetyltransferase 40 [Quercus suber]